MQKYFRHDWFILFVLIVIGLCLRLDFLIPVNFVIDSDEAIVGLMGKHILEGKQMPVFYYGQHYMGSFEPLIASILFKYFGISTIVLKFVPLIFSLLLIIVIYFLTYVAFSSRAAALTAALFASVPPNPLVVWSAKARGGFIEILVIGALSLYFCVKWLQPGGKRLIHTALIAALLGFGWWTNNQIIYFILPIGFLMLLSILSQKENLLIERMKQVLLHLISGCIFFILGGLPYWIYNINHHFISFDIFGSSNSKDVAEHIKGLFSTSIPILLGSKKFWEYTNIFSYSTLLYYFVYILLFFIIFFSRRKQIFGICTLRLPENPAVELFLFFLLVTFTVFSFSSFGYLVHAPRYLLPIYVVIIPLTAYALDLIRNKSVPVFYSLLTLILALNILSNYSFGRSIPGEPFVYKQQRVSRDHTDLIDWLEKKNINWVRTNYWIGYKLAFETNEKIRFVVFQEPVQVRIPEYNLLSAEKNLEEMPFILVPSQAILVQRAMRKLRFKFDTDFVNGYQIIHNIRMPRYDFKEVEHNAINAVSNYSQENAAKALDNDLNTRWGSAHPQSSDMKFELLLNKPHDLIGIRYKMGSWAHDWPRALRIEVENSVGVIKEVFDDKSYTAVRYFTEDNACFSLFFDEKDVTKVRLYQTSSNGIFDWSIAEIDLLEATYG